MEKLKMHSPDQAEANLDKLSGLFPGCVTEAFDESTNRITRVLDFDRLRQEVAGNVVSGKRERYQLEWPGFREAVLLANAPISKTLRPTTEESVAFDTTRHLFVEGDNLDALKLLREGYLGKVKLIYIDPPYNTGGDFIYSDDFSESSAAYLEKSGQRDEAGNRMVVNSDASGRYHSEWLSMMYPRLKLARDLLADDGVIVISIDENEHANLRKLCDLVFGARNFAGEIVLKNSSKNDQDYISMQHEYFVVYVRDKEVNKGQWTERKNGLEEIYAAFDRFKKEHGSNWSEVHDAAIEWYSRFPDSNPISASKHYCWMDERGVYFASDISGPNYGQYVYEVVHPATGKPCKAPASGWRYPKAAMGARIQEGRVHFGEDHTTVPNNKTYLKDTEFQSLTSMRFIDGRAASKRLEELFGVKVFTNPKDEFLLKDLMKAFGVRGNDIVMDFFAGSGTTWHALGELNLEQSSTCRCILVQVPEDLDAMLVRATGSAKKVVGNAISYLRARNRPPTIAEIAKERLRQAGGNLLRRHSAPLLQNLDVGFRVLKVDTTNMADVHYAADELVQAQLPLSANSIKLGRTSSDLLFQVLVDWGIDLGLPFESRELAGHTVYFVDGNALVACFETGVDEALVRELAAHRPLRAVFCDTGYASDSIKINVAQIFKLLSPETEVRSL